MAKVFQATHVGKIRQNNEDALTVIEPETFVVADGMGGAAAGEVASRMLVDIAKIYLTHIPPKDEHVLAQAILVANQKIFEAAQKYEDYHGMGTTATILHLDGEHGYLAHVGDSRLYLLRDGDFVQFTDDHSYVEDLVRRGELTQEQARSHPMRNVLTQAVGAVRDLQVDAANFPVQHGDKFLLCTDGLTNMLDDATIAKILLTASEPADALIEAALQAGGKDNITVIVAGVD